MSIKSSDLTKGEKFFLDRKRTGDSMVSIADHNELSLYTYRQLERDELEGQSPIAVPSLGKLTDQDIFLIHRRRSGQTVLQIADEIGCCMYSIRLMESGYQDDVKLREFWKIK